MTIPHDFLDQATPPDLVVSGTEFLSFSDSGGEYFRIWIVNLLLSTITLGIYSAWAKVRRLRYFYDNTTLAGTSFEYHGNPVAIFKGRIIAALLLASYQLSFKISPKFGLFMLALVAAVLPWLIWRSLQFKLHNSSYRGIRFGFRGSVAGAYKVYLLLPLLSLLTLYLLAPFTHQRIKRFQHNESRFGTSHFSFDGSVGAFYKTYLSGAFIFIVGLVIVFGALSIFLFGNPAITNNASLFRNGMKLLLAVYLWIFLMYPLFLTMLQNLIWNHTQLGEHKFFSKLRWGRMMFIGLTNMLGIVCTLGLFIPFAHIRMLRYRLESMGMQTAGALDSFIAGNEASGSAAGEGMSDLFDFDLSL